MTAPAPSVKAPRDPTVEAAVLAALKRMNESLSRAEARFSAARGEPPAPRKEEAPAIPREEKAEPVRKLYATGPRRLPDGSEGRWL